MATSETVGPDEGGLVQENHVRTHGTPAVDVGVLLVKAVERGPVSEAPAPGAPGAPRVWVSEEGEEAAEHVGGRFYGSPPPLQQEAAEHDAHLL